jgi:hypothetical protein
VVQSDNGTAPYADRGAALDDLDAALERRQCLHGGARGRSAAPLRGCRCYWH